MNTDTSPTLADLDKSDLQCLSVSLTSRALIVADGIVEATLAGRDESAARGIAKLDHINYVHTIILDAIAAYNR
jgi:hypothetical protein